MNIYAFENGKILFILYRKTKWNYWNESYVIDIYIMKCNSNSLVKLSMLFIKSKGSSLAWKRAWDSCGGGKVKTFESEGILLNLRDQSLHPLDRLLMLNGTRLKRRSLSLSLG